MAVVLYQRSQPRYKEWLPLISQQIRLRNLTRIVLINPPRTGQLAYFTLHTSPMSAPFYTSGKLTLSTITQWPEIQVSLISTRLSAPGCVIRMWDVDGQPIISWAVNFKRLHHLGQRNELKASDFLNNTIVFFTPFGAFTILDSLISPPVQPQRFLRLNVVQEFAVRSSYTLKNLVALHHFQRSVLEEHNLADTLRTKIGMYGFGVESKGDTRQQPVLLSQRLVQKAKIGRQRVQLKEELEVVKMKIACLKEEKERAEGRVERLKQQAASYDAITADTMARIHNFHAEKINLKETKAALITKGQTLGKFRAGVFVRKKQLISELLQIYPLSLVEGSKKYSINGVQLPNAEDYQSEGGGQISVALGYTAHLTAMLAFFLDIPCRYPIRHFGSRTRIIDHITAQIPDKEREFPLYFKGKRDVYCTYALYLLNKNVAQLRWYCGLSTPDLRATLPNLVELLTTRLVIPGWPPNIGEALEIAQEITEDIDSELFESEVTLSLDKGMDRLLSTTDPYLPDSFSDENPGQNSAALGEIQHGRGQERFLSGWKKKTYVETDDFDPKWLMDSMNLDFDTGRKFSMSSTSPPSRNFLISTESDGSPRKRRVGQVEAPSLKHFQEVQDSSSDQADLKRVFTPSRDIIRLELDIKENERKKSRGAATSLGIQCSSNVDSRLLVPSPLNGNSNTALERIGSYNENLAEDSPDYPATIIHMDSADPIEVSHTEMCNPIFHVTPPVIDIPVRTSPEPDPSNAIHQNEATPQDPTDKTNKTKVVSEIPQEDCDSIERNEESLLWMRTEALLGSSHSFNLVRRRMSTSEST